MAIFCIDGVIDKIDIDEIGTKGKILREVQRYRKFSYQVLNQESNLNRRTIDIDIRNYAKYILAEGSKDEKRELLLCLRSRLEIKDRTVYLKIQGKENLEK